MKLQEYLNVRGRGAELCRTIGVKASNLSDWKLGKHPVPISQCLAIETATGGLVTRKDLRPNDWQTYWRKSEMDGRRG